MLLLVVLMVKNSPGSRNVVPYSNSVSVHLRSSLMVVRIPKSTIVAMLWSSEWCRVNTSMYFLAVGESVLLNHWLLDGML